MTPGAIALFLMGTPFLIGAGYLWGVFRGKQAREELRLELEKKEQQLELAHSKIPSAAELQTQIQRALQPLSQRDQALQQHLQEELRALSSTIQQQQNSHTVKDELQAVLSPLIAQVNNSAGLQQELKQNLQHDLQAIQHVIHQQQNNQSFKDELQTLLHPLLSQINDAAGLQQELKQNLQHDLQKLLNPLMRQVNSSTNAQRELKQLLTDKQKQDVDELKETVQQAIAPMVEKDQLSQALAQLGGKLFRREELPKLLDSIAAIGGFSTVLLSDEVGLPLASNVTASDVDTHAGMASLIVTLVDRATTYQLPAPLVFLLRDEANQVIVHRVFSLRDERYVLTTIKKGAIMSLDALDSTLSTIENALSHNPNF